MNTNHLYPNIYCTKTFVEIDLYSLVPQEKRSYTQ